MTTAWNRDGVVNTLGSVFPPFKAILFFSLFFLEGGRKKKKLQQINRTINFLIYLLQRAKKKSMWSDRNTSTDSRKTFSVQVSNWNRTATRWLSGDRHLQFPDCIIEMGFLFPLQKSIIHNVNIKLSVLWVPESPPLGNRLNIFWIAHSFQHVSPFKGKGKRC